MSIPGLLAVLLVAACGRSEHPASRAELRLALDEAEVFEVYFARSDALKGAGPAAIFQGALAVGVKSLEQRSAKRVALLSGDEVGDPDHPRIIVGGAGHPLVSTILAQVGVVCDAGELVRICIEDPERPGKPLNLITAGGEMALLEAIEDLSPSASPLVSISRRRSAGLEVRPDAPELAPLSGDDDAVVPEHKRKRQTLRLRPALIGSGVSMRCAPQVDVERAAAYLPLADSCLARVAAWSGRSVNLKSKLDLIAVADGVSQREIGGESDLGLADGMRSRCIVLLSPGMPDDGGACAARWAAANYMGTPASNWWLDGAALDAADSWWGRELEAWGAHLVAGGLVPKIATLMDTASVDLLSQHQLAPARGLLFRYMREVRGAEFVRKAWVGDVPLAIDPEFEAGFASWLAARAAISAESRAADRTGRLATLAQTGFQSGVALDSNLRPGGGYDGPAVDSSLARAAASSADAVSITTYFCEGVALPTRSGGRIPRGRQAFEGDVAIARACAAANAAKIDVVLLQPHLLISESAGYSAWQRRTREVHWNEFFETLDAALVHYGLLSELCGVELLCVGSRESNSSANGGLVPEVKAYHDERWSLAIGLARDAFDGALTYAAAWPGEVRFVSFWKDLDYLGLSLFPNLAKPGQVPPVDAEVSGRLTAMLRRLDRIAREHGKPALIIEHGVRSTEGALIESRIGGGRLDHGEQRRALKNLADALAVLRAEGTAPAGLYIWKWDSDLTRGSGERGYSVADKPAALMLGRLGESN